MTSRERSYIQQLELPAARSRTRGDVAPSFSGDRQALVVGAQLAEFTERVTPNLRSDISNSILLAQLAANKATAQSADVYRWYDKYIDVLQSIGWQLADVDFREHAMSDTDGEIHKAIIPLVSAILGPAASAASIVLAVLRSMETMSQDSPWMTLFSRESQHFRGAKFQLSFVDADSQGRSTVSLMCFGIEASQKITQVLFFKFSQQSANLKRASGMMTMTADMMNTIHDLVNERVKPHIINNVKNIDI